MMVNINIRRFSWTKGYLHRATYSKLTGVWLLENIKSAKKSGMDFVEKRYCTIFKEPRMSYHGHVMPKEERQAIIFN